MSSISAGTTSTTGYVVTSDTTGALVLKTGASATTALTIDTSQNVSLAVGSANGVTYLNGSKVLTSGSTLSTDGTNLALGGSATAFGSNVSTLLLKGTGATTTKVGTVYFKDASSADAGAIFLQDDATYGFTSWNAMATGNFFRWAIGALGTETMRLTSTGLGIGTSSPVAKNHIKGTGTSGQVTASWILENGSSGTAGMDITGAAGSSYFRLLYGGGPSTGTNTLSLGMSMVLEGASAGNVGVGTTSPSQRLDATVSSSTEGSGLAVTNSLAGGYGSGINFYSIRSDTSAKVLAGSVGMEGASAWNSNATTSSAMVFKTINANTLAERARILTSGEFLVSTTTSFGVGVTIFTPDSGGSYSNATSTAARNHWRFANSNGAVGSIQTSGSATSYNTSSDYRLKNSVAPMTGALAKVALLKPVTYKWNADGSNGEGFIAHELADVVPDCVSGEKDAVETYVDEDGNEQTRPVYQGIDTSFLVATLTAAIQEQQAMIQQLQADVATLKGVQ